MKVRDKVAGNMRLAKGMDLPRYSGRMDEDQLTGIMLLTETPTPMENPLFGREFPTVIGFAGFGWLSAIVVRTDAENNTRSESAADADCSTSRWSQRGLREVHHGFDIDDDRRAPSSASQGSSH